MEVELRADAVATAARAIPSHTPPPARMAYLLSRYPAISHTFFLQEVLGLRRLGLQIETASINSPDRPVDALPPVEAQEAASTYYIKGSSKLRLAGLVLLTAIAHPGVFFRGLRAVLQTPRLNLQRRLMWLFYFAEAMLVGRWMRERKLPHLHVHFGGPVASVGMLTSIAWQVPYSLTIHGPEELQNIDHNHLREKLRQASFVLCISDFARSQLSQITPSSFWPRLSVVRLGVTPELLAAPPRWTGLATEAGAIRIVCTGRLVPEKAQRILLEAVTMVRMAGVDVRVDLIGDGPDRAHLEQFVQQHGLQGAVRFLGSLSHPQTLQQLASADLFVLASFAEGIPVALMEAMALGIPCISTTIAGIPELIRHQQDGLLVAPSNVQALAEAIALLASDPALRHRLGVSSRERVAEHYSLERNHQQLAQLLQHNLVSNSDLSTEGVAL